MCKALFQVLKIHIYVKRRGKSCCPPAAFASCKSTDNKL